MRTPFKTIGGVTPLKKGEKGEGSGKSQSVKVHAGDVGTKARTNKAQDKSGYNTPGPDFINVHAFGPNTRTTMSLANTLSPSISAAVRGKGNSGDFSSTDDFEKTDDLTIHHRDKVIKSEVEVEEGGAAEDYDDFWDARIKYPDRSPEEGGPSEGMLGFINDWKDKNPGKEPDLSKDGEIYKAWYKLSSSEKAKNLRKSSNYKKYRVSSDGLYVQEYHMKDGKEVYTGPWEKK